MHLATLVDDDYVKIYNIMFKVIISRKNNLSPECGITYVKRSNRTLTVKEITSRFFKELQLNLTNRKLKQSLCINS